jgi:bacterioferritin
MRGDPQVIDFLNKALLNELTAVQPVLAALPHARQLGVKKLAEFERHESIDEMKHADMLAERILFLEGLPNFQALGKLKIGESIEEILKSDLATEHERFPCSATPSPTAKVPATTSSREIFAQILDNEEEHVDFLERQFDMIARMGLENYVQLNSKASEAN